MFRQVVAHRWPPGTDAAARAGFRTAMESLRAIPELVALRHRDDGGFFAGNHEFSPAALMDRGSGLRRVSRSGAALRSPRSTRLGHPVVLRPVSSEDAMTADWTRLPCELLARISTRTTDEVPGANRVVLDVTSKPPGAIKWE